MKSSSAAARPVILCILDGWGHAASKDHNAIEAANAPTWKRLWQQAPHSLLQASAEDVGLPHGQMGNSEVGHTIIGAGRVVMQDLPRIDKAIAENTLETMPRLQQFIAKLKASGGRAHLLGLLSPGGVHSHQHHIASLAMILARNDIDVVLHGFTDGRDTAPRSAGQWLNDFAAELGGLPAAKARHIHFGTLSGRYYAMDRDNRWDRVQKAVEAITLAKGEHAANAGEAVQQAYAANTNDEFILPTVIDGYDGFHEGDALLMANFRADRARQLLHALLDPTFDAFAHNPLHLVDKLGMVEYSTALNAFIDTLFPPESLTDGLGETVAKAGLTQLRIAETEKYAHVTFFFNGGAEAVYSGEERILVPSPKVATYDLQPEMSAPEITDKLVEAITAQKYDLIVVNYANGDMVGHSGDLGAAVKAVEAVDACLTRLEAALAEVGGAMLITADHGNAEQMEDPHTHQPHTAHTVNPVPLVLVSARPELVGATLQNGTLADLAPTLLTMLNLPIPPRMTGRNLLAHA